MNLGQLEEAEKLFTDVVERRGRVLGNDHPETIGALSNLGVVTLKQNRTADALALLNDAMERAIRSLPADHVIIGVLQHRRGMCFTELRQFDDAEKSLAEASRILTDVFGPDHPRVTAVQEAVAVLQGKRSEDPLPVSNNR